MIRHLDQPRARSHPAAITGAAAAGALAAFPMALVMDQLNRWLPGHDPEERLPPLKITDHLLEMTGAPRPAVLRLPKPPLDIGGFIAHVGYGGTMGVIYGLLAPRVPGPPLVKGMIWGLIVWAQSYAGWLPIAGILPPPQHRPARRNATIVLAHLVWGALLGLLTSALSEEEA